MKKFENEFTYRKFLENGNENEFDELFDNAVGMVKGSLLGKEIPLVIGGKEVLTSEKLEEYSPIDRKTLIGRFQKASVDNVREAINAAYAAFDSWKKTNYMERVRVLLTAAGLFSERKFEISAILSIENGKTRYESIGEVDEAIDFLRYYAIEMERNKGFIRRASLDEAKKKAYAGFQGAPSEREKITIAMKPYGVFGVLSPFNFPISISVGMRTGALITGNTVVFKPSSTDSMSMMTGYKIYEVFRDAGIPPGVFNYITGPGSVIGNELLSSDKVSGIVFTGSREVGMGMINRSYSEGKAKVFVVEMGGKNPVLVSKYADLDEAASGIAGAAFGFDGQKCSAASRVYVHSSVKEAFEAKLLDRVRNFKAGDPLRKDVYLGPLINQRAFESYKSCVQRAKKEGRVIFGGNEINTGLGGFYVEPMVVEISHDNDLVHKELFLPFLTIIEYKDFDEALIMMNDTEYGLTSGCYTKKKSEIKKYLDSIDAGVVYVNRRISATTGAMVGAHTFVGWKGSGLTGKGTGSRFYLQQFMREQSQAVVD